MATETNRKRAGKKSIVTRKINQINELIKENTESEVMGFHVEKLKQAMYNVESSHEEYVMTLDTKDKNYNDDWLVEIQEEVNNCIIAAEVHIKRQSMNQEKRTNVTPTISMNKKSQIEEWQEKSNQIDVQKLCPVEFLWNGRADKVFITGSYDNWEKHTLMSKAGIVHTATLDIPEGEYEYKYIVDGVWKINPRKNHTADGHGGFNNILKVPSMEVSVEKFDISAPSKNESFPNMSRKEGLWNQLKRVSIPEFSGKTREYENWKAIFTACIDNADASDEIKLLQLRQYLKGEALSVIDGLGHTKSAYNVAKQRLD